MSLLEWNGRISECIKTKDSLNVTHSWWCSTTKLSGELQSTKIDIRIARHFSDYITQAGNGAVDKEVAKVAGGQGAGLQSETGKSAQTFKI